MLGITTVMTDHSAAGFVSAVDWRSISSHLRLVNGFLASIPIVKTGARFGCVAENERKARFGVEGIFQNHQIERQCSK